MCSYGPCPELLKPSGVVKTQEHKYYINGISSSMRDKENNFWLKTSVYGKIGITKDVPVEKGLEE